MEEKDRELKRARTVRTDYKRDVEEVQSWIQNAELKLQDRSVEPLQLKEYLTEIQNEIGGVGDKLDCIAKSGRIIMDQTNKEDERDLTQSTINSLSERLAQVKSWLEEKKLQVGETLDSWQRFMTLYKTVKLWVDEKQTFLAEPVQLSSLIQARQKLHDYSIALKSCKQMTKNLSDMSKELETISQVTNVGDLPEKLEEAEEAKGEVESQLLERNALLQETSEEWEQCEKKMKDVRLWIDKSRQALESPQNKKRPLRDQLGLREKMISDITIQKTKISISVEKLQLHFRSGVGGDSKVTEAAEEIIKELDQLTGVVKEQASSLETSLAQLDQYQQEIQQLRQQIIQVEQQIRVVLSPTYLPHDRDKAAEEQNGLHQNMDSYREQIQALMDRIHQIDPYMVILPEKLEQGSGSGQQSPASTGSVHIADNSGGSRRHQKASQQSVISKGADLCVSLTSSATYADIAAGRNSPCQFVEQAEDKDDKMKHLPRKTVIARTVMEVKDTPDRDIISEMSGNTKFEEVSRKDDEPTSIKVQELKTHVMYSDKMQDVGESLTKSTLSLHSEEVQSIDPQVESIVSRGDKSRPSRRGRSQQRKDVQERKNTDKLHLQNLESQSDTLASPCVKAEVHDAVSSCVEAQSLHSVTKKVTISEPTPVYKKIHHILLKQPQETLRPQVYRGRSPSPMWNPGSTSYADILRGRQVSEGHEETLAVTDHREIGIPITEKNDVHERKVQETHGDKYQYQQEDWSSPDSPKAIASFQQMEEVYVPPVDECPIQNVDTYKIDQTSRRRERVENVTTSDIVDSETFLQEEVISSVHDHDGGVAVPPGMFEYIQQPPPDLVGFIASGQQLLNSGLGTYHTSHQYVMSHDGDQSLVYPVTVTATQQPDSQYETLSLDSSHYVQPSVESVAPYTAPVLQDFVPQQYDLLQQAVLSDQDVASSPEVTPVHDTKQSKKVRLGHHTQTEMTTLISTAVEDDEMKTVTIHQIESDHQTESTDGAETEGDKCQLSYAQILAQGLCAKPLQPSSRAVNLSMKRNDRSQSPRPTSPTSSYSREWSASPSRDIPSTVREEATKSVLATDTTTIPKLENRALKKKKDNKMKKEGDGSTHVSSSPSGDQEKRKCGKIKQKKKQTVSTSFEFNGKQDPINKNKEEHVPVVETEATGVASSGEPLTITFYTTSVADNSLASVKDRKGGHKKSKPLDDGKKQITDSKPVSQISLQNNEIMEIKESNAAEAAVQETLHITDDKLGTTIDQEKKKQQKRKKKKKLVKHTTDDEVERALKEIAMMEMIFDKQKSKNIELTQEPKIEVMKQEKESKKSKKTKSLAYTDNANELIHEAEPKQVAVVASSVETATAIEGTNSQSITVLQETQDKNPEISHGAASKQGNENNDILKGEQSRKKKKRGKKPVCDTSQPIKEHEMRNSSESETINVECETGINNRQNILLTQKLEPFAEKQLEVPETTNIVEAAPVHLEQEVAEHLQDGSTRAVCKNGRTPPFDYFEVPNQESCVRPPDLLADIRHETEFLKTSEFESEVCSVVPRDADCKVKETEHNITNKDELGETSSCLLSRGKRHNKKQKNAAKQPQKETNKNDTTTFMIEKSHTKIGSIPLEEHHTSEITYSNLSPITVEDKASDSQKDKIYEQVKNASGPEVGAKSPIKGNKMRGGAKKGIAEQCEASQHPERQPTGSSSTSGLGRLGIEDDATSDDISVKKSTDVTDLSNTETLLSTIVNGIQDRDASKIKRNPKKSRKGKQPKIEDKSKPVTEKQYLVEEKPVTNEHEKNCEQVLQEICAKSAELLPAEDKTGASDLRVGNAEVVTSDLTTKGKSKKSRKLKSTTLKDTKEHSKGRKDANQDQAVNTFLTGTVTVTIMDEIDSELPSGKGKQSFKKSEKHKVTEFMQNKASVLAEDARMDTNGIKDKGIDKVDTVVLPEGSVTNKDNIHTFRQLEQTVTKSRKSNKKSKKLKSEDGKDEHLLNCVQRDALVIKNEDVPVLDTKTETEAHICASFEKQFPFISEGVEDQGTYQCMESGTDNFTYVA
ncbi:hypothetical protein L798_01015 [Zootermopsis nevadensis]|uniref:Nesprin-1 n=1 Tax=Zootermopsis nevadensis TaxID=136037 RepID=A0A067QK83_ZOONE|nr:hypothetical protein L798_01015 [Zootermopsis nevadensis]